MKGKFVLGVLTVTGILALSSTVAQAGVGGFPSALTSFFVCHPITGADVGIDVDVYSDEVGAGAVRTNVRIGQAILACAQAWLWPAGTPPSFPPDPPTDINPRVPNPIGGFKQLFELKCYNASVSKKSGEVGLFSAEDVLFGQTLVPPAASGTEVGIPGSRDPRLICGPAGFSQ